MGLSNTTLLIILGVLAVVGFGLFYYLKKNPKKEGYTNVGGSNLLSLDDNYEFVRAAEADPVPASHFADLVGEGDSYDIVKQSDKATDHLRPMERLQRVQGRDLMPRISAQATPYNVDIAQPESRFYAVNAPRVQLKDPVWIQSDLIRGDIPITYYSDVALIGRSQYGRDSINLSGYFSDGYKALYNKYSGKGYRNMPIKVSNEELIADM
jgi:hypothetical protein